MTRLLKQEVTTPTLKGYSWKQLLRRAALRTLAQSFLPMQQAPQKTSWAFLK